MYTSSVLEIKRMNASVKKPVNYLNNRDIMKEIHKSKNSYCVFTDPEYHQYDLIVEYEDNLDLEKSLAHVCTQEIISAAISARASRDKIEPESIDKTSLIFRVMTWDHIPLAPKPTKTAPKSKSIKEIFDFDDSAESDFSDLEDPDLAKEMNATNMTRIRVNFPPFQHYKFDSNDMLICVGKSHWVGDLVNGHFSKDHGQITDKLAKMYLMLCEKYALRFNWRDYCVDSETQALTARGWLNFDEITESDTILSYYNGKMSWSNILDIYRGEFNGYLHKLTATGYNSLVTPEHKMVTDRGLVKIEELKRRDRLVLIGEAVDSSAEVYSDHEVELIGYIINYGNYSITNNNSSINITSRNRRDTVLIKNCLEILNSEFKQSDNTFTVERFSNKLSSIFDETGPRLEFIHDLNNSQRQLLINTLTGNKKRYRNSNPVALDFFQALCAISGIRTSVTTDSQSSEPTIRLFSSRNQVIVAENIDFHGSDSLNSEFKPTPGLEYQGKVWCPKTEYGCFVARRKGTVYLTGNTYRDEMQNSAILQLTYVGLRFNEARSQNPFAYYSEAIKNSFRRVLNTEKKNQNIRDDILEMNGLAPSWSRQFNSSDSSMDSDNY